jgi:2',3'-cyclic-nucleotide 2'-phosphodiesterase (5'-nucleotidase family)
MSHMMGHRTQRGRAAILAVLLVLGTGFLPAEAEPQQPVDLQFLNVSDWHAQLDPLPVSGIGDVGGAAVLSSYWDADRAENPNSVTLTAGDAFGASPPLSNFFEEVPAVLAMRMMGFDVDTFGNHNFDRGIGHLQQMIDLAAASPSSQPGEPFRYVSANLRNRDDNLTGVEDFEIFEVGGVKVGVVGITNPEAPELVFPGNFGTIEPTDPVSAANRAKAQARRAGAKVLVAITHLGVTGFDQDGNPFGPLIDFAEDVGGFAIIFGDHTNVEFNGIVNNALVVENRSKGRTYAKVNLSVDPTNGRVLDRSVEFVTPVAANVTPDRAIEAMLQPFRDELAPILNQVVGASTVPIPRSDSCGRADGRLCESLVGSVVTDAMRTAYGTDFAITNAGGLRADLTCPEVDSPTDFCPPFTPPPFPITRGQVLTVLPFGNVVATLTVDGAELKTFLEQGVSAMPGANGRFAQVSGLCFAYDVTASVGSRVTEVVRQAEDGSCSGPPVDLTSASTYSLAINDFMASGGDGYPNVFSRIVTRNVMDQDVEAYIMANSPISPSIQSRIVCTGAGCPTQLP